MIQRDGEETKQQRRTDINSFKPKTLIAPAACIKYSQSESVQGSLNRLNRFIIFFQKKKIIVEMGKYLFFRNSKT